MFSITIEFQVNTILDNPADFLLCKIIIFSICIQLND